jgi:hypothetical protein
MALDPSDRRIFEGISRSLKGIQEILNNSTISKPSWNAKTPETTAEAVKGLAETLKDKFDELVHVMRIR